jgi:hypothetical protein
MNVLKQTFNLSHNKLSESVYDSHYNKIRDAVSKTHKVKYILTRHKKFHPVILSSLTDSKYVGVDNLSHYIKKKTVGYVRVTVKLSNRELVIYFVLFNKEDSNLNFEYYVHIMVSYIIFCNEINDKCSKKLTVYIYLTPFKKLLNKSDTTIGVKNVNTGVTYSCIDNNEICIYRKEEFLKVFFHEAVHSMGIDSKRFRDPFFVKKMNETFIISTTNNYFEAFTEFLGVHYYLMFVSFYLSDTKEESFKLARTLLYNEVYFSMYQMNKVLSHNGLSYLDLIKNVNTDLYRENTNVFSYYVLKTIMLYHGNEVFTFLKMNNGDLTYFLKKLVYDIKFIEETKQFQKIKLTEYLEKTMRMTIFPDF